MEKVVSKVGDEEINLHHEEVPEIVEEGGMGLEVGDGAKEYHSEEEECDGGEEQDYLHEEEEGGNVVEEEVEASAATWLDDSEEERMTNDDDGFGVENDWVDQVRRNINPVLDRWNRMKEKKKRVSRRDNVGEGSFIMNEEVGEHDINEEYNSDELDSDVESDEDDDLATTGELPLQEVLKHNQLHQRHKVDEH
ncbi:hypothetical protein LR48_Vigan11g133600 [Vigna angularis]|uniref:Uncharacterized protein n=1 Tax=Phaseolus angularis TaxID=3914 RepID=A0A0L9VTW3_PHAAN|nr:hypothetical protein LR48_Vigan11g133600 [Vigna angularis]